MTTEDAARYRLVRQLGAGGMAQVVEGVALGAEGFERRVAIKWILPELAGDESVRTMFLDEARIASRLHHANIVQVLDYGLMGDTEFIVFEYVDGVDMRRARRLDPEARAPLAVALHVAAEVAHALHYAHHLTDASGAHVGLVHRDVTTANILVSWDGDVKLSDFGIALFASKEEKTATGLVKGKLSYLAPEQLRGRAATSAVDVYALGICLHRLLGGRMEERWGRVSLTTEQVGDPDVRALTDLCCAEDPSERPTAKALAERLAELSHRHSQSSGRAELRDWLGRIRGDERPVRSVDPFAGRMMLGTAKGEFELTEPSGRISTIPTLRGGRATNVADETSDATTKVDSKPDVTAMTSRATPRRLLGAAAAVLAVAAASGVVVLQSADHGDGIAEPMEETTASPPAPRVEPTPQPELTSQPERVAQEPRSERMPEPSPAEFAEPTPSPMEPAPARPREARRRPPPVEVDEPRADSPVAMGGTAADIMGSLRVGGAQLVRGRVSLDGRVLGQAPGIFEAPVGQHTLRVESLEDGTVLLERTVDVRADHTRTAPLRVVEP